MKFKQYQTPVSNRTFGFFFSIIFAVAAIFFYDGNLNLMEISFGILTFTTLAITIFSPNALLPFNRAWMYLGILLGKIINPVIMAIFFFVLITPIAVVTRIFGRDELRLKRTSQDTYWKSRDATELKPSSFKNQF